MSAAILYEVNTRVWLRELSEKEGRNVTLADIPESEIARWSSLGFTHIWLMGVWQVGSKAREIALRLWREHWSKQIDSREEDVQGSPFAIEEYAVDARIGDALSLLMLKERLGRAGLRLILDFVPNHLGIDSTEPVRFPARFVYAKDSQPGTFLAEARFGPRYFAHGRDPHFEPWSDTVQLDYRVMETHEAMRSVAQTISMYGDGLRCDMAMLLLPEIFAETWKSFPSPAAHQTHADFWRKTIAAVRQLQPQVQLIAEVYWDREEQLQELGFDYTYNKRVCDYLVRGQEAELIEYLRGRSVGYLSRSVHFLENHDEAR
ncbi:MAG: alpha-amylase family glycosyl hydrolase, partial [Limisphaerales bacterium]